MSKCIPVLTLIEPLVFRRLGAVEVDLPPSEVQLIRHDEHVLLRELRHPVTELPRKEAETFCECAHSIKAFAEDWLAVLRRWEVGCCSPIGLTFCRIVFLTLEAIRLEDDPKWSASHGYCSLSLISVSTTMNNTPTMRNHPKMFPTSGHPFDSHAELSASAAKIAIATSALVFLFLLINVKNLNFLSQLFAYVNYL